MLIPITHENLKGRRLPVITIAIIALNLVAFLLTYSSLETENKELSQVRLHILLLAAAHPEAQTSPVEQTLVERYKQANPMGFKEMANPNRNLIDAWDVQMRLWEDPARINDEMATLGQQWEQLQANSSASKFAFVPAQPTALTYITANFLHGGWLHIIFNMWFLWLAGTCLEDAWGRVIYPIFYLVSGVVALLIHALVFPTSMIPVIGASGAVAGLMGAFLVRFTKTRIELMFVMLLGFRPYTHRFKAPAYLLLPLWLAAQLFSAAYSGQSGGVAYHAHIGGFLFGVAVALVMRFSGLEHKVDQKIEAQVSWTADPRIVEAGELLGQRQHDAAIAALQPLLLQKPDNTEALEMLSRAQWAKQDIEGSKQTLAKLCALHVKANELDMALQSYDEFRNVGGDRLPALVWIEICRHLEKKENWDRAASEFADLAHAYPKERASIPALVSAARLQLKKLNRPSEAAQLYREADSSPVPHLDWNSAIKIGLKESSGHAALAPASTSTPL
jgi:membrane associated rhomboid family serine protease